MKNDEFSIVECQMGNCSKFIVKGRINAVNVDYITKMFEEAFKTTCSMVVNMEHVIFLSSCGIRILLMYYKQVKKQGGSFYIEKPSENVKNVLGMVALDELMLQ